MVEGEEEVVAKERTMEITDTRTSDDDDKVDRNASSLSAWQIVLSVVSPQDIQPKLLLSHNKSSKATKAT